jgi:AcrR family transcriptional regulator
VTTCNFKTSYILTTRVVKYFLTGGHVLLLQEKVGRIVAEFDQANPLKLGTTRVVMPSLPRQNNKEKPERTYAGVSLVERKKLRKKQFLEAGLKHFGSCGFRNATVRSVCKEAKLTDRYFYESYSGLESLLKSVYEDCMTELSKQIVQAIIEGYKDKDPNTAIIAGLDKYFEILEDANIARICMVELEGISPEVNRLYYHYINGFAEILRVMANQAFPNISIERSQQDIMAISLVGAMRQAATNWLVNDYDIERKELVTATSMLFLGIIKLIEE